MIKQRSRPLFTVLALSLILVVGLLPISAKAYDEQEVESLNIWADNRTTPHPWAPSHIFIEGDPMYVVVEATYTDGSAGFLSAEDLDFTIIGDFVTVLAQDTGDIDGQIRIEPEQPLLTYWFSIKATLKTNPEISSACGIEIDELVLQLTVVGQEHQQPVVKRGESLQLSYEVYPEGSDSRLVWEDWQKDFPDGKIGTDSYITKDGLLYVGANETENHLDIFPPISNDPQPVRYNVSAPSIMIEAGTPPHTHEWDDGVVTISPTQEKEGLKTYTCKHCDAVYTESIPKLPVTPGNTDASFLQEKTDEILQEGLSKSALRLSGKILTLVLENREFILSTNAKNRNISGEISLGDGYYLKFDIKGNGSNIKDFKVFQK